MTEFVPTKDQIIAAYRAERRGVVQLVESISDEEWGVESGCEGWSVGELAAHLTHGDGVPWKMPAAILMEVGVGRGIEYLQRRWAGRGREFVLGRLRKDEVSVYIRWIPGVRGLEELRLMALAEIVIHAEDIRRPLGKRRPRPLEPRMGDAILSKMWRRLREIDGTGPLGVRPAGSPERVFMVERGKPPVLVDEGTRAHAVISGPQLEFMLRLSGRRANLLVEGEGPLAEAARAFADVKSERVGLVYWR